MSNEMIRWIWNTSGGSLRPYHGISEMEGDRVRCMIWNCHGCLGELRTYWRPYEEWVKPNEKNFKHTDGCKFLKLKSLVEEAFKESGRTPFYNFYEQ